MDLDRFVIDKNRESSGCELVSCAEFARRASTRDISLQKDTKVGFTGTQLDRRNRHISALNEMMARQDALALRLGWPGIGYSATKRSRSKRALRTFYLFPTVRERLAKKI